MIAISDPSGTGEILGPKYFEEFAVTYINRLLDSLQKEKLGTIVHICGQMSPVYKEINEVGSSALSFDSIVPMKEARKHLPDRVLMGNVSTYALEFGDPARVKFDKELHEKRVGYYRAGLRPGNEVASSQYPGNSCLCQRGGIRKWPGSQ